LRTLRQATPARRVTMAEIAAAADVSVPTVSKVLNGRTDVAPDTRRRVEALLASSGYGRTRRRRVEKPWLIDLVFSELGPYATEIIRGAEEAALMNGCRITVSALTDAGKETRWLNNLGPGRSDGVMLVFADLSPEHRDRLKALGLPVVIVDPTGQPDPRTPSVGVSNWAGGMTATEHLIGLGHRRIGIVCGRMAMLCNQARLGGYRAALERAGIAVDPALVVTEAHQHPSALAAASALLDLADPPTAIFATSDTHATGVYEAARLHGLNIPHDLSVVGFDDIPMAAWASPPLTTMRQPLSDMAALGVRLLLGAETQNLSHRMELATGLIVRASTAAIAHGDAHAA
jgi:LacI family transcriptional regulator